VDVKVCLKEVRELVLNKVNVAKCTVGTLICCSPNRQDYITTLKTLSANYYEQTPQYGLTRLSGLMMFLQNIF
jgi:hypothetical protein